MTLSTIVLIVLILFLIGALQSWLGQPLRRARGQAWAWDRMRLKIAVIKACRGTEEKESNA